MITMRKRKKKNIKKVHNVKNILSIAQGLEILLLMNFLNIPFFFFRLVYRHGADFSDKAQEKKSFLD